MFFNFVLNYNLKTLKLFKGHPVRSYKILMCLSFYVGLLIIKEYGNELFK